MLSRIKVAFCRLLQGIFPLGAMKGSLPVAHIFKREKMTVSLFADTLVRHAFHFPGVLKLSLGGIIQPRWKHVMLKLLSLRQVERELREREGRERGEEGERRGKRERKKRRE